MRYAELLPGAVIAVPAGASGPVFGPGAYQRSYRLRVKALDASPTGLGLFVYLYGQALRADHRPRARPLRQAWLNVSAAKLVTPSTGPLCWSRGCWQPATAAVTGQDPGGDPYLVCRAHRDDHRLPAAARRFERAAISHDVRRGAGGGHLQLACRCGWATLLPGHDVAETERSQAWADVLSAAHVLAGWDVAQLSGPLADRAVEVVLPGSGDPAWLWRNPDTGQLLRLAWETRTRRLVLAMLADDGSPAGLPDLPIDELDHPPARGPADSDPAAERAAARDRAAAFIAARLAGAGIGAAPAAPLTPEEFYTKTAWPVGTGVQHPDRPDLRGSIVKRGGRQWTTRDRWPLVRWDGRLDAEPVPWPRLQRANPAPPPTR